MESLSMTKSIGKQQKTHAFHPPKFPVSYPHLNDIQDLSGNDGVSWAMSERKKISLGKVGKIMDPWSAFKKKWIIYVRIIYIYLQYIYVPRKWFPTSSWLMQRDSYDDGRFPRSPLKWVSGNPHVYRNEMCFVIDEALWYMMKSGDICSHVLMKTCDCHWWYHDFSPVT